MKSFCYFWALDIAPTYVVPGWFLNHIDWMLVIDQLYDRYRQRADICIAKTE